MGVVQSARRHDGNGVRYTYREMARLLTLGIHDCGETRKTR